MPPRWRNYESYRQCLQRWRQERPSPVDLTPAFYNLISALLHFLGIERCRRAAPHALIDLFPEVSFRASVAEFLHPLQRKIGDQRQVGELMRQIERDGCAYLATTNSIYARCFGLPGAAAAAARFVQAACSGRLTLPASVADFEYSAPEDRFYALCLNAAIAEFGARILYSARQPVTERELYSQYTRERRESESEGRYSQRDRLRLLDFLVLHKHFECHARSYRRIPELIAEGRASYSGDRLRFVTDMLGQLLGTQVYQSYLDGRVNRRYLRSLYLRRLQRPGEPKLLYFQLARRTRNPRLRLPS